MNQIYNLVWNATLKQFVVAHEFATAKGKGRHGTARSAVRASTLAIALSFAFSMGAQAQSAPYVGINSVDNPGSNAAGEGAIGDNTIAIGGGAKTGGEKGIAIGEGATVTEYYGIAVGYNALVGTHAGVAIGNESYAGESGTALGNGAKADGASSTAVGTGAYAESSASAFGNGANASGGYSVAIGVGAEASGGSSVALGDVGATGEQSIAVGTSTNANGRYSNAQGYYSNANGTGSIAIGSGTTSGTAPSDPDVEESGGYGTIALGNYSTVTGARALSFGNFNEVVGEMSGVMGDTSTVNGAGSYAIGNNNTVDSADAMVLGNNVTVGTGFDGAVVLGTGSTVSAATAVEATDITFWGTDSYNFAGVVKAPNNVVSVGAVGSERQIQNVAAGRISETSTDAINGSQLWAVTEAINKLTVGGGTGGTNIHYVSINSNGSDNRANDGATGMDAVAIGEESTASGSGGTAVGPRSNASGSNAIAVGNLSTASGDYSVVTGNLSEASGMGSVVTGSGTTASGYGSVAVGGYSESSGYGSVTVGGYSMATNYGNVAVGGYAEATGDEGSIALGGYTKSTARGTVAIGGYSEATGEGAVTLGGYTKASDYGSMALGGYAVSTGYGSIAIGGESDALAERAMAVGPYAVASGVRSMSFGNDGTVSGEKAGAFGDTNTVSGAGSYAVGNANTIESANAIVVGNNVTVGTGLDGAVALGNDSTVTAAVATPSTTIKGTEYAFAGGAPAAGDVVSVGAVGKERQIQNVAAGQISATSTDAINGSQLWATNQAIENLTTSAIANQTHYYSVNDNGVVGANYDNDGASGVNSLAAGVGASATHANSVAIGAGSATTVGAQASYEGAYVGNSSSTGEMNVGGRTISGVAPGIAGTDAANINQLKGGVSYAINEANAYTDARVANLQSDVWTMRRDYRGATSSAMAMAGLPQAYLPGKSMLAVAAGGYQGEYGVAVGLSGITENGRWVYKAQASGNTSRDWGFSVGAGIQW